MRQTLNKQIVVFFARLLKEHPIPTNLSELTEEAEAVSA